MTEQEHILINHHHNPSDSPVSSLKAVLNKAQVITDKSSIPWQKNLTNQAENVLDLLQQLLTILTNSTMHSLVETIEDASGDIDYKFNFWLRLVVLHSLHISPPLENEDIKTARVQHYSRLVELSLQVLYKLRQLQKMSSKLQELHKKYKKYTGSALRNPETVIPVTTTILLNGTTRRKQNRNHQTLKDTLIKESLQSKVNPKRFSALCILTVIKRTIILEYCNEESETLRIILPTGVACTDNSFLEEFLNHFLILISRAKDGINSTSESLKENIPMLESSISKLITTLERHKKHDRLRASVCSADTRQALMMVESRFMDISSILSETICNLNRVVGVADYLAGQCTSSPDDPILEALHNSYLLKTPWWWPFKNTLGISRFRQNAIAEAEEFLNELKLNEQNYRTSPQLLLPVTPQLANLISQYSSFGPNVRNEKIPEDISIHHMSSPISGNTKLILQEELVVEEVSPQTNIPLTSKIFLSETCQRSSNEQKNASSVFDIACEVKEILPEIILQPISE